RYARFGLAPKGKADYAFLLHDLYHIKPDGIMTIVLPHGVLFRGGEEGSIRKNLIENNHIDAIIGLPANIFFGTGIPTIIMVLRQKRENTDILIIDASKNFTKVGKNSKLQASDIKRIADTVAARRDAPKFARVVSRAEVRDNDYNLNIPRYVDSVEPPESWDIYASMLGGIPITEVDELAAYWQAFPGLRSALFTTTGGEHVQVVGGDIQNIIDTHPDVQSFTQNYAQAFSGFDTWLRTRLIDGMQTLSVSKELPLLAHEIFSRLEPLPLVDNYTAYQLLADQWAGIELDIELIQNEGFAATKAVDPHLVVKKKNGKDVEVQDGYQGRVLPFELVQQTLLHAETAALAQQQDRLALITAELQEMLDSLSEDEKEEYSDALNDDNTAFLANPLAKKVKELLAAQKASSYAIDNPEHKLITALQLLNEEKELKKSAKASAAALHLLTKQTIEGLSDEQVYGLLEQKWIVPLTAGLEQLPVVVLATLTAKVQALAGKYATTLADVEKQIATTESELTTMLNDLTGSDTDMAGLDELKNLLGGK
ncbi:type I restriction-modification system subunit M, partial [Candidatus Saccharibacteria bacterium]|nr:type I restriction-modification system subunit M [Candidatus Saccharibacteria bacterium]